MPQRTPSGSVVLDINAGNPAAQPAAEIFKARRDDPFRMLILGDFSGNTPRSVAGKQPQRIDRDNFDEVLRKFCVRIPALNLTISELADFEPDSLFRQCEAFRALAPSPRHKKEERPAFSSADVMESQAARLATGSLLDEIVEQADAAQTGRRTRDQLQSFVERAVAPHLVRHEDTAAVDESACQRLMRAILHNPQFQALEGAWRGLDLLTRRLDTDGGLSIYILDVSKKEIAEDLTKNGDQLYRLLVQETVETPGGQPWAVIIGNYVFGRSAEDAELLARLATLARKAQAPFIGEAEPPAENGVEWEALRKNPDAGWIGLALPRFLSRLPYGRATYTIESFGFEEIDGAPRHSEFLWTNPAFACGLLLGRSYNNLGWNFRPGTDREIDGLPYFTFEREGETQAQPCAEVLLTDSEIDSLHEQGLMALASMKNRGAVFLMRFHSIAEPLSALAGRWQD